MIKFICQIKRWNTNPLKSHAIKQPAEQWLTLLTVFASTLSIKAAAWAAILYLSLHHCLAGFSNVKNVTAFNIWKENVSSQGISLSTTLICPRSAKPPLCNDVTICHIWNILTSTSGDMNALKICAWAMIRRLLV